MAGNWLEKSLASLAREVRDWPHWKRNAAQADPHLALGNTRASSDSGQSVDSAQRSAGSEPERR